LKSTIEYYDAALLQNVKVSWETYDVNHYLQQAMEFYVIATCSPMYPKRFESDITTSTTMVAYQGPWTQGFSKNNVIRATVNANVVSFKGILGYSTISSAFTMNSSLSKVYKFSSAMTSAFSTYTKISGTWSMKSTGNIISTGGSMAYNNIAVDISPANWTSTSSVSCVPKKYHGIALTNIQSAFSVRAITYPVMFECNMTSTTSFSVAGAIPNITIRKTLDETYLGLASNNWDDAPYIIRDIALPSDIQSCSIKLTATNGYFNNITLPSINARKSVYKSTTVSATTLAVLNTEIDKTYYYPFKNDTQTDVIKIEYQETYNGVTTTLKTKYINYAWTGSNATLTQDNTYYECAYTVGEPGYIIPSALKHAYYDIELYAVGGGAGGCGPKGIIGGSGGGAGGFVKQTVAAITAHMSSTEGAYIAFNEGNYGNGGTTTGVAGGSTTLSTTTVTVTANGGSPGYTATSPDRTVGGTSGSVIIEGVTITTGYNGGTSTLTSKGAGGGGSGGVGANATAGTSYGVGGIGYVLDGFTYGKGGDGSPSTLTLTGAGDGGKGGHPTGSAGKAGRAFVRFRL
jgi:hypothetical protein